MGMGRLGLVPHDSLNSQDEACGCRVGTKTELRGRSAKERSQARVVMQPGVQNKWLSVVFVRSGPGNDRTRLVPSTGKEQLAPRVARGPVCKCLSVRGSNCLPGSLPVGQSVRVGLLGNTATSRQSRADRSVGEVRDARERSGD